MNNLIVPTCLLLFSVCKFSQEENICQDCKGLYEYPESITWQSIDTLPVFRQGCSDKLLLAGTVYQSDGITPASGVIMYIYHTNEKGKYPSQGNETGMAKIHGYNRSWIKTGPDGKYGFVSCKPGHYPSGRDPSHIHIIIKEPDKTEYWISDFLFEGDPKLTAKKMELMNDRGGSGLIPLIKNDMGAWIGFRDIYLGKNIPGYE